MRSEQHNVRRWCALIGAVVVSLGLAACGPSVSDPVPTATTPAAFPSAAGSDAARIGALWARSCALCHIDGNGGAPVVGDVPAWETRAAKGRDELMRHTIEGFNNMPPLGYCMACSRADFDALIDLMVGSGVTEGDADDL